MATEDRWHDFAKEKPSEDMEGRDFIVSNGHYEKIATWCGYWENEPFMGDRLCDEVVRWKFYFTPEEEKANEATRTDSTPMKCDELKRKYSDVTGPYYGYNEVNEAIAELKAKLEDAKASHYAEMVDAGMRERRLRRALWLARAATAKHLVTTFENYDYLGVYKLNIKQESARTWMTCKLRTPAKWIKVWSEVEIKCLKKAEEYR